ncbi:MAG: hypothetical protein OER86_09660 [Phycisphaerae bacterium]|nr:hypothetical protein [Phycisphaerae bacterium]
MSMDDSSIDKTVWFLWICFGMAIAGVISLLLALGVLSDGAAASRNEHMPFVIAGFVLILAGKIGALLGSIVGAKLKSDVADEMIDDARTHAEEIKRQAAARANLGGVHDDP